jgi:fibronectin-binding autotransporter adhesin
LTLQTGGIFALSVTSNTSSGTRTIKSLAGSGTVTNFAANNAAVASTLAIDGGVGTDRTEFSGTIQNAHALAFATSTVAVTKTGSTTQVLSGNNTYTGQTQVNGGALFVNGTHIEASVVGNTAGYNNANNGHYLVANGATLGGSGRIAGFNSSTTSNMILVQSGGFLAPGGDNALGTFVLDGGNITGTSGRVLNMASGAKFDFTISGSGGVSDQLAFWNFVAGDVVLNSNAIDLSLSGPQAAGTYTVSLFEFFSDAGSTSVSSGIVSGLTIGTLGAGIDSASLEYNGSSIDLTYTVSTIPEPASAAALLGLVALCGVGARRRVRRA